MPSATEQSVPTTMPMCPMAFVCKGMMRKPFSGVSLIMAGVVFVVFGVLMVIEPRILVWVVAAAFILLGIMMLMIVGLVRRMFHGSPNHE